MKKYVVTAATISVLAFSMIAPAFAAEGNSSSMKATKVKADPACISTAVSAREQSILSNFTTFSSSLSTAYQTRATALSAAWAKTDAVQRKAAIKAAWDAFHKAKKTAKTTWMTGQKTAWNIFKTAAKNCKADASAEMGGSAADMQM